MNNKHYDIINIRYLFIIFIFVLFIVSCNIKNKTYFGDSVIDIYSFAQEKFDDGDFKTAVKQFEILDNEYPFSAYSNQVKLNLIYAYYKLEELELAVNVINRFIRINQIHDNMDYVIYMRGLIAMDLDDALSYNFFYIDNTDRDVKHAFVAFKYFSELLRNYPNSLYANDAKKRLFFLKNRLANFDFSVVKYYIDRGVYVAVINRVHQMLKDYPDTKSTFNALKYMKKAYKEIGLNEEVKKIDSIIAINNKK